MHAVDTAKLIHGIVDQVILYVYICIYIPGMLHKVGLSNLYQKHLYPNNMQQTLLPIQIDQNVLECN